MSILENSVLYYQMTLYYRLLKTNKTRLLSTPLDEE
nr:MAG TPA: hypothetical protein [Bacteriophage sp.]